MFKWQTTCQHCAEVVLVSERQPPASWPAEIKGLSGQCVDLGAVYWESMSMLLEGTQACVYSRCRCNLVCF